MQVTAFQMKESMFVNGIGEIKSNVTVKFYPGMDMKLNKEGTVIVCTYKNKKFLVPVNNCKNILVEG